MGDPRGITAMSLNGNTAENWKTWRARFENYLIAAEVNKKDEATQCAQLLHYIGEECYKIYTTLEIPTADRNKLTPLLNAFERYFKPRENLVFETYKFITCRQEEGQTMEQFINMVKQQAAKCKFKELNDRMVKCMIICGVSEGTVRERLLQNEEMTLQEAVDLCTIMEKSREQNRLMSTSSAISNKIEVDWIGRGKYGAGSRSDSRRNEEMRRGKDRLIFSGEYTKAMNKDWHGQHFCCWQCDESLTGQRYVLRDDHPYCVNCYESVFANACEKCSRIIGIDSKDLSYKDKHWHEACFLCTSCNQSLVDKQFGSKGDRIYCGNCYDQQFASRCDGCGEIFRAGTKKMEYKTRQWHEKCFCCCVCKVPIGTQSFIPREQEIYCAKCYEEKFATRCIKCNKVITSGGVTYKNEPWHRECFICTHCERSLAGERFTSRDEKPYCAECFGELFAKRCYACNKPITGIGGTKFISFEDRHWHNECFICASCKTSLVGRGFITDQDDIICPECAKKRLM